MADDEDHRWHVRFGRLAAAADGATDVADGLSRRVGDAREPAVRVASAHPGMAFAASLVRLHGAFGDVSDRHVQDIHSIGRKLRRAHRAYLDAEEDTRADVARVLGASTEPGARQW